MAPGRLVQVRSEFEDGARWRQVYVATSFRDRLIGLMGRAALMPLGGLWLEPGGGIHTIGMRFPIDCLFLDSEQRVLRVCPRVAACRLRWAPRATRHVLELAADDGGDIAIGTRLIREAVE